MLVSTLALWIAVRKSADTATSSAPRRRSSRGLSFAVLALLFRGGVQVSHTILVQERLIQCVSWCLRIYMILGFFYYNQMELVCLFFLSYILFVIVCHWCSNGGLSWIFVVCDICFLYATSVFGIWVATLRPGWRTVNRDSKAWLMQCGWNGASYQIFFCYGSYCNSITGRLLQSELYGTKIESGTRIEPGRDCNRRCAFFYFSFLLWSFFLWSEWHLQMIFASRQQFNPPKTSLILKRILVSKCPSLRGNGTVEWRHVFRVLG